SFETMVPVSSVTIPSPDWPSTSTYFNTTSGSNLPTISGTAYDLPVGAAAGIWKVLVEVRDSNTDGIFNGDDNWFDSNSSNFSSSSLIQTTFTVSGVTPLPWTVSIPMGAYATSAGRKYMVRSTAYDLAVDVNNSNLGNIKSPPSITSDNTNTYSNV